MLVGSWSFTGDSERDDDDDNRTGVGGEDDGVVNTAGESWTNKRSENEVYVRSRKRKETRREKVWLLHYDCN